MINTTHAEYIVVAHFEGDSPEVFRATAQTTGEASSIVEDHMKSFSETEVYIDSVQQLEDIKKLDL